MSLSNSKLKDYIFTHEPSTSALRNYVASRIHSSDSFLTNKLSSYHLFWKFYDNEHWSKNNQQFLSFNWVKAIINKVNEYTLGSEGFEFNITDEYGREVPEDFETAYEALVGYTWNKNKKLKISGELLQMGGIAGDSYMFLWPDFQRRFIRMKVLDTRYIVPLFEGGDYNNVNGYQYVVPLGKNEKEYISRVTEYTVGMVKTYYKKDTEHTSEKYEESILETGLAFIPIVHIENSLNSGGFGGYSDAHDIIKLNKVYNEMAEDVKEIIDYYTTPVTVITGGHVGNLVRGIGQIWSGLPADANVTTLGLGEDLSGNMDFLEKVREAMHDLTGVPQEVLSKVQHISNTSAASLRVLYHSLTMAADKKTVTYSYGISDVNEMATLMYLIYFQDIPIVQNFVRTAPVKSPLELIDRYKAVPVWKYGLPNDRMTILQEGQIEQQIGVGSRRTIMERLGVRNIPKEMDEIRNDDFTQSENTNTGITVRQEDLIRN